VTPAGVKGGTCKKGKGVLKGVRIRGQKKKKTAKASFIKTTKRKNAGKE